MLNKHLLIGAALALPFFMLNALVVSEAPVADIIRLVGEATIGGPMFVLALLALVFIGGIFSLYPVFTNRRFLTLNILVGVSLIVFSAWAGNGLGKDVYRCEIMQIPNCD